ncbi:MAG TPA: YidC/Oxa1 family membrane protein insertase [Candidatus Angelobacter sp.]
MPGWDALVGLLAALLCTLAQMYGGNLGLAIITVSVITRLALLPLTLRMARHAQAQQKILHSLRDNIARLRKRYRADPKQLAEKLAELYRANGVKPVDGGSLAGGAVQALVGTGLYSALRRGFAQGHRLLWVRDLGQPNAMLALAAGAITLVASLVAPRLPEQSRVLTTVLPAILTVVLAWRLSSAVVLYWASSAAMNGVQSLLLRRRNI